MKIKKAIINAIMRFKDSKNLPRFYQDLADAGADCQFKQIYLCCRLFFEADQDEIQSLIEKLTV